MSRHTFFCIDAHTCGNPVRVVTAGAPLMPGLSMAERRQVFVDRHDWIRRALMFEPRGHDVMSGVVLYPSTRDDCDIGFLFIEVSGCLPMCGHGTIGTVTAILEEGLIVPAVEGQLAIEVPAGRIEAEYTKRGPLVEQVRLHNVASYLHAANVELDVPGMGMLHIDLAYGGNYYAIVEPQASWRGLTGMTAAQLITLSPAVRRAAEEKLAPVHPEADHIRGVSHVMWCDAAIHPRAHARNAVFYGTKAIDRSPCGTGSSARMAQLAAKGRLSIGAEFVHESIIGTLFDCRIEAESRVGSYPAILPSVAGWARVIGHNTLFVDDRDPLMHGFQLT
ncbi:MAG TPA: 4-hydroxyproline epimerase [Steroidobacteraceae bacterium]|jgi:proline racemase|nr:4-hydroxyproline epimerase [Steroidobacteraceae bacterium]